MAASYFHGNSEVQGNGDVLQTLILMNPAYVGYSDNHHQLPPPPPAANFTFVNSNSSATASQIPHFAGIPVQAAASWPPHQQQDVSELHRGSALPSFHYNLYNPLIDGGAAREVTRATQGLSLSLSSQQPMPSQPPPPPGVEEVRVFGWAAPENVVLSCKYLKVAQQLLDEVVNIGKETKDDGRESAKEYNGQPKNTAEAAAGDGGAELTTAQKQEIQMKKAKLVDMLDEVEQRYKQYEQQMQMVIRWFGEAAGAGPASAKPYTALALQTISKQFRCLKDAIMSQIRAASKNLGEEDHSGGKIEASRLKYIDHQRALQQQFGMIRSNAWRPQRGLPERAVSVLRAWLFQHFLHPYPKDTDKIMLAKRAGLTRSQVSNWFINARVRLWKPMVEEMYTEEMMGQRRNNGSSEDEVKQVSTSKSTSSQEIHDNKNTSSPTTPTVKNNNNVRFSLIESSPKKDSSSSSSSITRNADVSPSPPMSMQAGAPPNFYGTGYHPMEGMEQFQPSPYSAGNGVSLTLGLQHCENRGIEGNDFGSFNDDHSMSRVYDNITDARNGKRHLLPDFVT